MFATHIELKQYGIGAVKRKKNPELKYSLSSHAVECVLREDLRSGYRKLEAYVNAVAVELRDSVCDDIYGSFVRAPTNPLGQQIILSALNTVDEGQDQMALVSAATEPMTNILRELIDADEAGVNIEAAYPRTIFYMIARDGINDAVDRAIDDGLIPADTKRIDIRLIFED